MRRACLALLICGCAGTAGTAPSELRASALTLHDVDERDRGSIVIVGDGVAPGQRYVIAGTGEAGLVEITERDPLECDHCPDERFSSRAIAPWSAPLIAIGPVRELLPRATAERFEVTPTDAWARELEVDLDGDGTVDLERVTRCAHTLPSGCDDHVCDRVCRATRTAGASEVRGELCVGFVPDVEDCQPRE